MEPHSKLGITYKDSLLYIMLGGIIVVSFLFASGGAFKASYIVFFVFVILKTQDINYPEKVYNPLNTILSVFAILVTISFVNFLDVPFDNLYFQIPGCGNYINLFFYALLWYFIYSFTYEYQKYHGINKNILFIFSLTYFIIGIYYNIYTYNLIRNVQGNEYIQHNSPYFVIISLPIISLFIKNKIRYLLIIISIFASFYAYKRSCLIVSIIILAYTIYFDMRNTSKIKTTLLIFLIGYLLVNFVPSDFWDVSERTLERINNLSYDGGSNRLDHINNGLNFIEDANIIQFLIGKGFQCNSLIYHGSNYDVEWISILNYYGIVGFVLYLIIHVYFIHRIYIMSKYKSDLLYSMVIFYIIFAFYSISGEMFTYQFYSAVLFLYLGYTEAIESNYKIIEDYDHSILS